MRPTPQPLDPIPGEPEWLARLRAFARETSIAAAGAKIGRSRTAVSLALAGKYPAKSLAPLRAACVAAFQERFPCPGLGEAITPEECREWAEKPFAATSGARVAMYRACQACPHRPTKGGHHVE